MPVLHEGCFLYAVPSASSCPWLKPDHRLLPSRCVTGVPKPHVLRSFLCSLPCTQPLRASENWTLGPESWLCLLLVSCPWVCYLLSWSLGFLIFKMIVIEELDKLKEVKTWTQCLACRYQPFKCYCELWKFHWSNMYNLTWSWHILWREA